MVGWGLLKEGGRSKASLGALDPTDWLNAIAPLLAFTRGPSCTPRGVATMRRPRSRTREANKPRARSGNGCKTGLPTTVHSKSVSTPPESDTTGKGRRALDRCSSKEEEIKLGGIVERAMALLGWPARAFGALAVSCMVCVGKRSEPFKPLLRETPFNRPGRCCCRTLRSMGRSMNEARVPGYLSIDQLSVAVGVLHAVCLVVLVARRASSRILSLPLA